MIEQSPIECADPQSALSILKDGADFGRNELSFLCFQYGNILLFPVFEVDDPETVLTTDVCFLALWGDD